MVRVSDWRPEERGCTLLCLCSNSPDGRDRAPQAAITQRSSRPSGECEQRHEAATRNVQPRRAPCQQPSHRSLRIAACGLQKEPREETLRSSGTLLACIKHTGNDRVPEIGRERPLTQCARAANPRAASCKPVDTKIPFIHTSPLHITSLLQSMGFASKGVLWSGVQSRGRGEHWTSTE